MLVLCNSSPYGIKELVTLVNECIEGRVEIVIATMFYVRVHFYIHYFIYT